MRAAQSVPSRPVRGGALDALRFLAAAFIVLYHFGPSAPVDLAETWPVLSRGWLATDFFLLLSGYVLGRAYGPALDGGTLDGPAFLARRVARVWPGHLMILAGFVVLVGATTVLGLGPLHPERFGLPELISEIALIQAWGVTHQAAWNEPSWTLSALVVCYALFPLAWRLSQPIAGRLSALAAALTVLLGAGGLSLSMLGQSLWDLPFHLGVIRAAPLFLAGLLLARFAGGWRPSRSLAGALLLSALGLFVALQAAERSEPQAVVSILAVAVIILTADALRTGEAPMVTRAARVSFALFISHALAGALWFGGLRVVAALGGPDLSASWTAWAGAFPFALACAWAFDRWADAPVQRWIRARLDARPSTGGTSEPALS